MIKARFVVSALLVLCVLKGYLFGVLNGDLMAAPPFGGVEM